MHIRPVSLMLATLAFALAVACGGSDNGGVLSGGNSVKWDVSKAEDLSHAALLVATDLGGTGWRANDDDFDDDPLKAAACADFESFKKDAKAASVARAKRSLERRGASASDFGTEVEGTIQIVKDAKTASDLVSRYRGVIGSDKFIPCFEASVKEDTSLDAKVTIKKLTPSGSAPNGGTSAALDVDVSLGRDQLLARSENYVWAVGNAVIQLNVTATKDSVNADLVKTAIAKQEQAANDAAKGSRTRVTEQQASSASTAATPTPQRGNPTPSPTTRPGGTTTPTRGASGIGKVALLEDTTSHRYTIKIESSGIDFFGMEDLAKDVASLGGNAAPRAGAPITVEIAGAYSKPDKGQVKFTVNGTSMALTTIGTQQWTQLGTTTQGPRNVGRQSIDDLSVAVAMLEEMSTDQTLLNYLKCSANETVNGGPARKCGFAQGELSRSDLQEFIDGFLEESDVNVKINAADVTKTTFNIWIANQGDFPVKLLFEFAGKDTRGTTFNMRMEANVTDINRTVDIVAPR
jgi:hypothetical protein